MDDIEPPRPRSGHDPLKSGIFRRFLGADGFIIGPLWNQAVEKRELVATCRRSGCGGMLQAVPTHKDGHLRWYGAECLNCGAAIVSPEGRTLARSSRQQEMPGGAWERRLEHLKKLQDLHRGES